MISAHRKLLRQKEDLYDVLGIFGVEYFYDDERLLKQELFNAWREYLNADIALKNEAKFFFCKKIEDIEFEMVNTDVLLPIEA